MASLTMYTNLKSIHTDLSHAKLNYTEKHHYKSKKSRPLQATTTTKQWRYSTKNLKKAMDKKTRSHHIVMGDFNVRIGVRNINENMKCIGPFGTDNRNERGERLLDFGEENNLIVTNSLFLKSANRYWTWEAPGGVTKPPPPKKKQKQNNNNKPKKKTSYCLQIGRL